MSSLLCATIFKKRNMFGKFECKMCYLYNMGGGCLLNIDKLHFEPYVLNIFIIHNKCSFDEYIYIQRKYKLCPVVNQL